MSPTQRTHAGPKQDCQQHLGSPRDAETATTTTNTTTTFTFTTTTTTTTAANPHPACVACSPRASAWANNPEQMMMMQCIDVTVLDRHVSAACALPLSLSPSPSPAPSLPLLLFLSFSLSLYLSVCLSLDRCHQQEKTHRRVAPLRHVA